jgi:chromosome segregation ATPase
MLSALLSLALVLAGLRRLARTLSPSLCDTIIELAQERDELRHELQVLVSEDVALACDGHELLKRRCTLSRETAALARAKADFTQDVLNLENEKAVIVVACNEKSAELEQLIQRRDARHDELDCIQATLMNRQRELDQALATLATTRSDIVTAEHELSSLGGQVKTTRDQYDVEITFMESRVRLLVCLSAVDSRMDCRRRKRSGP